MKTSSRIIPTISLRLFYSVMADVTKQVKTSPVTFPEEIVGNCDLPENTTLKSLVDSMRSSKTVFDQMNCFGVFKKEICKNALYVVIYSAVTQ